MPVGINDAPIEQKILTILRDRFNCDDNLLVKEYWDVSLTWKPYYFSAVQLTYLFLEIEKEFNISIPEHYVDNYNFNSITQICDVVGRCVEQVDSNT